MTSPSIPTPANAVARRAAEIQGTDATTSFLALLGEADTVVRGRNVVASEDLENVPFIITSVTFREGKGGDYVSLECTAADAATLNALISKGRLNALGGAVAVSIDQLPIFPNEEFVINDSSTGIRRQMVQYLQDKDLIAVNDEWDFTAEKKKSIFDQPMTEWIHGADQAKAGITGLRFLAQRGTQVSKYQYGNDEARTVYLA